MKTKFDTDKSVLEKKVINADKKYLILGDLLIKTDYNTKLTEIESKMPSISGLVSTSPLITVENKISDVSNLVKKQTNMQKYYILNLNILLQLISINLSLDAKKKEKGLV